MTDTAKFLIIFVISLWIADLVQTAPYYGKFIGKLSELHHGVSGEVYAVDGRTLYLKDFTYDGQGPAAYFYASTGRNADKHGFRLRDENGGGEVIRRYRKEGVTLTLPEGKTINNIKIFYVWCEEFDVNFGDVKISRGFDYPRPQKINALKGVHGISSDPIVIVDAQTLLIPNLSYDGEAPDAKFWVGQGTKPSPQGIRVPDENGKEVPLRRYSGKTIVLTLPGDLTIFDIGHFGIWCEAFTVDFGHIQIPQNVNVPPSLKMLGVSPQSKLNCEVLYDDLAFEVRWAVAGDSIVLQLVAKLDDREYMSFGISGDDSRSEMIGGDVVVAWIDRTTSKGFAEDYHLGAKSQCSGPTGSCPDDRLQENSNNVRLLNSAMVNGYSIVTYQRSLKPSDEFDRQIHTNRSQAIIWAIGPLNQRDEVSFHTYYTKNDQFLDFGRPAKWNCPVPESEQSSTKPVNRIKEFAETTTTQRSINTERRRTSNRKEVSDQDKSSTSTRQRQTERKSGTRRGSNNSDKQIPTPAPVVKRDAWDIPAIKCYEPEDGVFYAQFGPTGGKRGYPAITGHVGWGISWYINGLLIPEINVVRGRTYTFVVEGGFDPEIAAKYHPFYITDDPVGGYEYKTAKEKQNVKIFAGAVSAKDGTVKPTGVGRLCHWTQQGDLDADDFESFGAYQRTLELKCDQGEPGVIQWTPDKDTPDTVYYQCFTHRYLGWKINVHDSCDELAAPSELITSVIPAPLDLKEKSSLGGGTKVKPNSLITEDKEDKNNTTITEQSVVSTVTEAPILIQPPTYMSHVPLLTYPINSPFFFTYHQPTLRPSPPLGSIKEDFTLEPVTTSEAPSTLLSTTRVSTSTSTSAPITSTQRLFNGKLTGDTTSEIKPLNQSFPVPPKLILQNNFVRKPIIQRRPPQIIMRTPVYHKTTNYKKPVKLLLQRPHLMQPLHFQSKRPNFIVKPNIVVTKHQLPTVNFENPNPLIIKQVPMTALIKNVEISHQQASTEKAPELQTAYAQHVEITQPSDESHMYHMNPAVNTGFKPESVVIESGFKPIITKEFQKRISEDETEKEYEGLIGVTDKKDPQIPQQLEPMFVPSPIDKHKQKRPYIKKVIIKHSRSVTEEPIAAAAERVDSYYLPPADTKFQASELRQSSNFNPEEESIGSPPDVVVTYDGKRVSGASLTARIADSSSILDQRSSKAAELIKARPQFVPFKGELPPLNPEIINQNAAHLQNRGALNRDLDAPVVTSTRLSRVKQK